eukprot:TRINITY_DN5848_c0_g5_i1.p1 TRINITY_DN5848_c0_g5~~TRINITY_DN5848_c0_g5_i1.p1  ORF type:complete len:774 (+),score=132.54 TRINITY_DN5848_c0_g5_i1:858-3179(+)
MTQGMPPPVLPGDCITNATVCTVPATSCAVAAGHGAWEEARFDAGPQAYGPMCASEATSASLPEGPRGPHGSMEIMNVSKCPLHCPPSKPETATPHEAEPFQTLVTASMSEQCDSMSNDVATAQKSTDNFPRVAPAATPRPAAPAAVVKSVGCYGQVPLPAPGDADLSSHEFVKGVLAQAAAAVTGRERAMMPSAAQQVTVAAAASPKVWVGREYFTVPHHPVACPSPEVSALQPSPLLPGGATSGLPSRDPRLRTCARGALVEPRNRSPPRLQRSDPPPPPEHLVAALRGVHDHLTNAGPGPAAPALAAGPSLVDRLREIRFGSQPPAVPAVPVEEAGAAVAPGSAGVALVNQLARAMPAFVPPVSVEPVHMPPLPAPGSASAAATRVSRSRSPEAHLDAVLRHLGNDASIRDGGALPGGRNPSRSPKRLRHDAAVPPPAPLEMEKMKEALHGVAATEPPASGRAFDEYKEQARREAREASIEREVQARLRHRDAWRARGPPADPRQGVPAASPRHPSPVRAAPPPPPDAPGGVWRSPPRPTLPLPPPAPVPPAAAADPFSTTVDVVKHENEPLGASFDDAGVLVGVAPGGVAARHGLRQLLGRRLATINGQPVRHVTDITVLGPMAMTFVMDLHPIPPTIPGPPLGAAELHMPLPHHADHHSRWGPGAGPAAASALPLHLMMGTPPAETRPKGKGKGKGTGGDGDWRTAWAVLLTHLKVRKGVTFEDVHHAAEKDRLQIIREALPDSATQRALTNTTWLELSALLRRRGGL